MKNRHLAGKFRTTFESGLWTVTRVKGTLVTVTRGSEMVTRNISCFKKYHGDHFIHHRSESDRSHEVEDEDIERPGFFLGSELETSHTGNGEDVRVGDLAPTGVSTPVEESLSAEGLVEKDSRVVSQRRGEGRYYMRSRVSPPERLKDYVCE
ncbi:hypothetical protein NDU88_002372 [Pleurodeles waltl]|uniref:Uncharacterized protein n=1 Tax=Pleurodeles waltl TaxID=8319 RepID=A0AAV7MPG1_PLEWA|nr:hypothetical protein NDU88_002372 [Pleurodeles waltl]